MHEVLARLGLKNDNDGVYDGHWRRGSGALLESLNPADEARLARVHSAGPEDYERVVTAAQQAAARWRMLPAPARGDAVRLIADALRRHKAALGALVSLEMGKIRSEGEGEVQEMIDIADFAVGQSRMLYGRTMHSERPRHRMYEQWHPLGVVGIVTAFNFPVAVWAWNALIAAVCGNASVWRPSPKAPLCAIAVQRIVNEALAAEDLPPVFQLLIDADIELAQRMADDRRIDLLSFTGSTPAGRAVAQRVAARLGRSLLELGGNNAIIVDAHANLDLAVPAIVFGAVGTAGQRCTTTRRVLVHASMREALEARLLAAYEQVRIGDPLAEGTLMGPLIDEAAVDGYRKAIQRARDAGGEVLCGDRVVSGVGHFVEPTIIRARNEWEVVQQEVFAPILYLIEVADLDEAITAHNAVAQGLSSAIFTDRLQSAEQFLSHAGSDCGIANVNIGTSGAEIGGAFGGEKDTGGGREAGSDAWKAYMRRQTTTINYGDDLPLAQGIDFRLS
ncbi:MAG: aldehyde dehydrogenase family protein [Gammaproteobacteria bacterium]|nr:aldehyde dehydrogenase family protein [Gammaproteobacteria bacterium]